MGEISIIVAFFAGVASFLSPCVLPLIPAYINILTNGKREDIFKKSILFIIGFTVVFITIGASASFLGQLIEKHLEIFKKISGGIIILFGIYNLEIIKIGKLYREKKFLTVEKASPVIMGMAFAMGWTPCVGPILGTIIMYTSINTNLNGIMMLGVYSLGLGIPFLLSGLMIERFDFIRKHLYTKMSIIKKIVGVLIIIVGILIMTNKLIVVIGLLL